MRKDGVREGDACCLLLYPSYPLHKLLKFEIRSCLKEAFIINCSMYWVGWVFQICAHIFAYLYLDTPILSLNFSLIMSLTCPAPTPSTPSAGGISGALLEAGGAGGGNEGGTEGAFLTGCIRPTAGEDRCTGADLL